MRKFINNLRISSKIFRKEKTKIIMLLFVFLLTCISTIIVGSMSLEMEKALYVDDTNIQNKIVKFEDDNINPSILKYAESFENKTIVKRSTISTGEDYIMITSKNETQAITPHFTLDSMLILDTKYDTYNKYDEVDFDKQSFSDSTQKEMIIQMPEINAGPAKIEFLWEGILYSTDINIIAVGASTTLISPALYDYFLSIIPSISIEKSSYTFSFDSVRDAVDFYHKTISLDMTLESKINFPGASISRYITSMKEAGVIICVIAFIVLVTLIICFLNMLVILFMDKQRNMGLLKAQGLSNKRMSLILLQALIFYLIICCVAASVLAYILMPVVNSLLNSVFLGQFISDARVQLNLLFAVLMPIIALVLVVVPCIAFVIKRVQKPTISLLRE